MTASSRPRVPIAMGSGGTGTEENRAFFQRRLTLFGGCVFAISGGFGLLLTVVRWAVGVPVDAAIWFHIAGTLVAGALWLIGRSLSPSRWALEVLDVTATCLMNVFFALMAAGIAQSAPIYDIRPSLVVYVGVLANTYVLMARAIAVPSTAARTVWVSALASVPLGIVSAVVLRQAETAPFLRGMLLIDTVSWLIAAVAMSTIASRVIFGLRQEVSQIRTLGQYTIEGKIGEGGMGIVYRARHALLRRPTAIKLLPPDKAGAEDISRFEREVRLTASLSHPNTVAIFDYGHTMDGVFYYAMEYLDGIDLEQLVAREGPLSAGRVVHILRQVVGALAEAHDIGLIHRDVKPANIVLCERGGMPDVAKVVDFGLVKRFRADSSGTATTTLLDTGLVGTPHYMAPECFIGEGSVDARTDLYAVGAVAYLLLTGTTVFRTGALVELLAHHLHTRPEPLSERLGRPVSADLEALVLRCLAKSPNDRPHDARVLGRELERCAANHPWSEADASAWWSAYQRTQATRRDGGSPMAPDEAERAAAMSVHLGAG